LLSALKNHIMDYRRTMNFTAGLLSPVLSPILTTTLNSYQFGFELELELIQNQMAQKLMLWVKVHARAFQFGLRRGVTPEDLRRVEDAQRARANCGIPGRREAPRTTKAV